MRPSVFNVGETLYWTIHVHDAAGQLVDADSTPAVAVRRDGVAVADAVTVTKRAVTTGLYDCSYNPASETDGEAFELIESVTISSAVYMNPWSCTAQAVCGDATLAKQSEVLDQAAAILSKLGSAAFVRTNVLPGGKILLKQGDAYTSAAGNLVDLDIDDTGEALKTELQAANVASIVVGLKRTGGPASEIVGSITKNDITHTTSTGKTHLPIVFTTASLAVAPIGDYRYDIQKVLTEDNGNVSKVTGDAELQEDYAE